MDYTPDIVSIVDADQADTMRQMAAESGIEGAVGLWSVPLWADGANPEVDAPVAFMCAGWMHNDLVAILPEGVVVPPVVSPGGP